MSGVHEDEDAAGRLDAAPCGLMQTAPDGTFLKTNRTFCTWVGYAPEALIGRVSFVSPSAEYTLPIIYSRENRNKLVYLVEARPSADAKVLKPGQIVDVVLPGAQDD